jgi:tetratricopeptide (TPR) repeat protein
MLAALLFLQAVDYTADGLKALDAGQYQAAAEAFQKVVAADPGDFAAHFNLALAYGFLHRDGEGIAEYRKTLELKPGLYEADLNCGILLLRQKDAAAAVALLQDAAGQKPGEFRPRYYLAEAQFESGALEQAAASYRLALELDRKSAGAELGLGRALARQQKLAEAEPHYRQAVALDPKMAHWLLELAGLYEKDKQPAEALAIYRQFPEDPAVQAHVGQMMLDGKQYAGAISSLEEAFAKEPSQANRVALVQAYMLAKQPAKALPLAKEAVAAEPAGFEVRMMYGRALQDSRQFAAAAVQFQEALKLKPENAAVWGEMGGVLLLADNLPDALAAFQKARQLGQDTPGNCFFQAIVLDKMHYTKPAVTRQAMEAYQRFLGMSQGKNPDQEFQARQRARILRSELERR